MDEGRAVQNIQVIVRSRKSKKNVSYVQTLISHRFEYDGLFALPVSIIALPSNRTIFPFIVHAIQRCKHTWKSTCRVYSQLFKKVCTGGLPQVVLPKLSSNCDTKPFHALHRCGLTSPTVIIHGVCAHPPCKHPQGSNDFLTSG